MKNNIIPFAPDYLMRHYSTINKSTYNILLHSYYKDNCTDTSTSIVRFYYKTRSNPLKESDLSYYETSKLLESNQYIVYCWRDISNPHILTWCTDIVFKPKKK